jgi:NAD(P)-dependent dehydrogenase (short-subunit alcohol dehydrogenase family)
VLALAETGADVAFSHRESARGAQEAAEAVRALGRRAWTARADARQPGEIARFVDQAAAEMGGIDLLVHNAGVFRKVTLADMTEDVLDEAFAVHVKAAVMAARAAAPHMRRRGRGSIVNVASLGGLRPWPSYLAYCATKAALVMATQCLALSLAPDIRVNAVAPGIIDPPGAGPRVREKVPQVRFGTPAEVVEAVLFLAAGGGYTTGEVIRVDGGRSLR